MLSNIIEERAEMTVLGGKARLIIMKCTCPVDTEVSRQIQSSLPYGIKIEKDERGKPYIVSDGEYRFVSFSHTDEFFLCALSSQGEIGADIELKSRRISYETAMRISMRYFTDSEREHLIAFSASADFYLEEFMRIWTKKEAYCKMTGEGLKGLSRADTERVTDCKLLGLDGPWELLVGIALRD